MAKLAPKYKLKLLIAHINYGLRGKNSDSDEKFVRKLAEKYGIEINVLKSRKKSKIKISENVLREIRYVFFKKTREKYKFDLIAVAHNSDDQVETFLMRIIRGSGLQGLSSMKFKNDKVMRPLLGVSRKEILEYLKENKLKFHIDKTNKKNLFLRNKIRNRLIPYLEKNYNPNIRRTILKSTATIADDYSFISELAGKATKGLSAKKVMKMHPSLQRSVIRNVLMEKKKELKDIDLSHIEEVLKIIKSKKNKSQSITFQGLKLVRKGDKVTTSYN